MTITEASVILSFAQILLSANIDSLFLLSYYFRKFFESKCGLVEFIAMKTLQNGSVQVPIPNSTTGIAKEWSLFSLGGGKDMKTINYQKSKSSLKGSITVNGDQSCTAVTAATSKAFNSLKNAKDFMSSKGYEITWYER